MMHGIANTQLQLHRSVQESPALMHLHLLQPLGALQLHFISSLQALAASGTVIHTIFSVNQKQDNHRP